MRDMLNTIFGRKSKEPESMKAKLDEHVGILASEIAGLRADIKKAGEINRVKSEIGLSAPYMECKEDYLNPDSYSLNVYLRRDSSIVKEGSNYTQDIKLDIKYNERKQAVDYFVSFWGPNGYDVRSVASAEDCATLILNVLKYDTGISRNYESSILMLREMRNSQQEHDVSMLELA